MQTPQGWATQMRFSELRRGHPPSFLSSGTRRHPIRHGSSAMIATRFPAVMTENRSASFLQTISHVLVVGAGVLYLFGFIVVSAFDASYGISDFSFFRTKVIAVGCLFVFLLAL